MEYGKPAKVETAANFFQSMVRAFSLPRTRRASASAAPAA
jgi:hypothetical protein